MSRILGIVLVVAGILVILFGSKWITTNGGVVLRMFAMPRLHAAFLRWAGGLLCVWFGLALLFGALDA
ncbi:hypothetical protein FHW12_004140 [Dokdonella fugitiva]|uniref:Uncharacterized protein n=1 Tax=Dokdonella fugitiva TaxID=328517 RepID=A0A839F4A6_9GAMM|nr:DUF3185 family protein [Dokdonella fugitiva]MBA8889893.1 hypothetical protein [Dokdonella fugitiva]